jgi:hypothetical protein
MQRLLTSLLLATVVCCSQGCLHLFNRDKPQASPVFGRRIEQLPSQDFVSYLNRQAGYLQSVRYNSVSMSAKVPGQWIPRLGNSMIVCSKPANFRMTAGAAVGGDQLDVGSNSQEMWMYVKQAETPFVYCSQSDFPKVQNTLPVKFEPNWVLQALGMAEYDPNKNYTVTVDERTRRYILSYEDTTATGQQVLKQTEISADTMDNGEPQVRRHTILARDGKTVLAEARIRRVQEENLGKDPTTGLPAIVQLPTDVLLEWPQEKVQMELRLGQITVNEQFTQQSFSDMFERPRAIGRAQPINLADYIDDRGSRGVNRRSNFR